MAPLWKENRVVGCEFPDLSLCPFPHGAFSPQRFSPGCRLSLLSDLAHSRLLWSFLHHQCLPPVHSSLHLLFLSMWVSTSLSHLFWKAKTFLNPVSSFSCCSFSPHSSFLKRYFVKYLQCTFQYFPILNSQMLSWIYISVWLSTSVQALHTLHSGLISAPEANLVDSIMIYLGIQGVNLMYASFSLLFLFAPLLK